MPPAQPTRNELIHWLRQAKPTTVMAEAVQWLQQGVSEDALWATSMLTACRYVNNQAHNLLGFVSHAMIGGEDARRLAAGQDLHTRHLILLQALYQTVLDLHDPSFSPYELLPFGPIHDQSIDDDIRLLRSDIHFGEYSRADHRFVGLAEQMPRAELVDLLLDIGLEGVTTDDHTIISPVLSLGTIELVGWEDGFDMLRWAIRYNSSFPIHREPYGRAIELRRRYALEQGASQQTFQPDRVQALREVLFAAAPADRPEVVAQALAEQQFAPETVIAAVAQASCDMYLRVDPVPHEDFDAISREVAPIHIGNALRLLRAGLAYMSPGTQALAAIQAGSLLARGPSVLNRDFCFVPFEAARAYPYAEDLPAWERQTPPQLLASLYDALYAHDCRQITAIVQAYAQRKGSPAELIALLTNVAATDNGTLMHNLKHLNSMVQEFHSCTHPDRWNFLMQAAKFVGWYAGLTTTGYTLAEQALAN